MQQRLLLLLLLLLHVEDIQFSSLINVEVDIAGKLMNYVTDVVVIVVVILPAPVSLHKHKFPVLHCIRLI